MVALAERWLAKIDGSDLRGRRVYVFGGTGPVGNCVGLLAARCGAEVALISNRGAQEAQASADACNSRYGVAMRGADGGQPGAVERILDDAEIVFNAAKAGVRVLDKAALAKARRLRIAADANAVPPSGIEGVGAKDNGVELATAGGTAHGLGALAIGDVKYRVHTGLLAQMYEAAEPLYLAHDEAFELARSIVATR
jgi:methylene-tetrahydromethanopterin dehydrogenase